ncbi:hypothetical protein RHMOL_Rhmol12G0144200 [Rhododendron molle]|uniref:Uncharacterized protein n=1 Tax=Rhododendron molle TaxID=49168 RepID=A0ACC0LHY1_RHOML|nr:hypothetical protein RHMOL_Rhmol12G0144200 [Rhododendron molle]
MLSTDQFKEQSFSIAKKLLSWASFALLSLALFTLYFFTIPSSHFTAEELLLNSSIISTTTTINSSSSSSSSPPPREEEERANVQTTCDYSNGTWVPDKMGPLYNGTSCGTISDAQNCMSHGRPDLGYLDWRWKPHQCNIPRFEPQTFLQILRNKHLAFVGDTMSRNQVESLICMLATVSTPRLLYSYSDNDKYIQQKFRRWYFPSHNVSISAYWSPFLVQAIGKTDSVNYSRVYLDSLDERWASYLDLMDIIVLSPGHWFLQPAVYFDGNSTLGCHMCTGQNYDEVGFYDVFGKILKITLDTIVESRGGSTNGIGVIMTTFSPQHFEGEQDEFGACPKTRPFEEGEKQVEGMDAELRRIEVEEIEAAKENAKKFGKRVRLEVLDVTKLSLLRGDGHPGPYLLANPFANNGTDKRVQDDCVNWCLPGPVDTWNEILLDLMKRWDFC